MKEYTALQLERHNLEREFYRNNTPFPHIVIDDFLTDELATKIIENFPSASEMSANRFQKYEKKIATSPADDGFPAKLLNVLYALNSHEMINFLEKLTGITGILPDPNFLGAGLQQTMRGGKLGVHVDFNKHKKLNLDRRINVLIYLNKDWKEEWDGALQLWDKDMENCMKRILPIFNRCVIFNTTGTSFHGLPDPIKCPSDNSRKQINLYYYTNGRNDDAKDLEPFWTQHYKRPGNFNDHIKRPLEKALHEITPPIISNFILKRLLGTK